jgi:predicted phosphate transport protein (TIGR00153 family)
MNPITSLFGSSPFKPLQAHMRMVRDCVAEVPGLFEALCTRDGPRLIQQKDIIFAKEKAADALRNQLSSHLPKSLFMPVDRRDLLDMLNMQDSIANTAQDIAGLVTSRTMLVPEGMAEPLQIFVQRCVDACNEAATIVEELDELVEIGFRGREVTKVEAMIHAVQQIESETDLMGMALSQQILSIEDSLKPVTAVFWYQLLDWIGDLADYAEKVGERMGLLLAR